MGAPPIRISSQRVKVWPRILARPGIALAPIVLIAAGLYVPALREGFVYHDFIHVQGASVTSFTDFVKKIFDPSDTGDSVFGTGNLYRPVYYLTLFTEQRLFGLNPLGYHLVNFFVHLLNVVLVGLLARRLTGSWLTGNAAALVFAIHPVYTDAPAWISIIHELSFTTFTLLAIHFFISYLQRRGTVRHIYYVGSVLFAVLAAGTREAGAMVPFILAAYYFLAHRPKDWRRPGAWLQFIPLFAIPAGYAMLRLTVTESVVAGKGGIGIGRLDWHIPINIFKFNGWIVVPTTSELQSWLLVLKGAAAIAFIRASEHLLVKGNGTARFLVVWWYLAIFPFATQETTWIAGRYLYMGGAAFAIMVGLGAEWLARTLWWPKYPWQAVVRGAMVGGVAAAVTLSLVLALRHEKAVNREAHISEAFIHQLLQTYPSIPAGSTLYIVDPPEALLFDGDGFYLRSAVRLYYNDKDLEVLNLTQDQYKEIVSSLGSQDLVFFYRPLAYSQERIGED